MAKSSIVPRDPGQCSGVGLHVLSLRGSEHRSGNKKNLRKRWESVLWYMAMDQYLLIPFLGEWTSIYQLFWCELQGYKVLTHCHIYIIKLYIYIHLYKTGWWFGTWSIFPYIANNNPNWLTIIFFRGVETTNQIKIILYILYMYQYDLINTKSNYMWVDLITTSLFSRALGIMVSKGKHPQMAELFRLVKYYNLPRYI